MTRLEFWPDYGGALLWDEHGVHVAMESLPIPDPLKAAAAAWVQGYGDEKLPWEPTRDDAWLIRGRQLLTELRLALRPHGIEVQPHEAYWEAPASD